MRRDTGGHSGATLVRLVLLRLRLPLRIVAIAAAILVLALPGQVSAHAEIVAASPSSGTGLVQAPAAVVIKFSEPLNPALSRIVVLDGAGKDVGTGSTEPVPGDPDAMQRPLGLLPTGQYTVRWTSVSLLDGHTLQGTYVFGVGTAASSTTSVANSPLDSEGPLGLFGRFVALISLGLWFGSILLARPARRAELDDAKIHRLRQVAPALAFLGTALAIASSSLVATGSLAGLGGVFASQSGQARLIELAASGAGFLLVSRGLLAGGLLAAVAIVADAASGHAAATPIPLVGVASFALHLGAVGVWIFAIAGSLFAATNVRRALGTFTPFAVTAAAVTAASGILNAVLELADPADLVQTGYGQAILVKSVAFMLMASFGFAHFLLRRRPWIADRILRGPMRSEASSAVVALLVATLMVGFPNPPRETAAAEQITIGDPVLAELGSRSALSIGAASGHFVVGLTILPPEIGQAEVRVDVVGVEAGDGLRNAGFTATMSGSSTTSDLSPCGLGCFAGTTSFGAQGDWRFGVHIDSNRGPIEFTQTVPLPTPDGGAAFAGALGAIEGLKSAEVDEKLSGSVGGPSYATVYRFKAPDSLEFSLNGSTSIIIGQRRFDRTGDGPWTESSFPAPGFSWPTGYYRQFWQGPAAIRILGTESVGGVPSTVISFVRTDVPAWFRIWIGMSDGLIHRMEMRAQGHIMDHTYVALNGPVSIQPPPT